MDLDLETFIEKKGISVHALEEISRMECPIMKPDRTMKKVSESTTKRIALASKRLRMYFSLTETLTCRGCQKRRRCKWFRQASYPDPTASCVDVMKVLFGLSQYCRYYLQYPKDYPPIQQDFIAATTVLDSLQEHIEENQKQYYEDVPLADWKTARELLYDDAGKKLQRRKERYEERMLNLPPWMQDSMQIRKIPQNFSAKQKRALFGEIDAVDDDSQWLVEGEEKKLTNEELQQQVTELDDVRSIPMLRRFDHTEQKQEPQPLKRYSTMYGQYVNGVYNLGNDEIAINLNEVPEIPKDESFGQKGGYTIVDLLDPKNYSNIPKEALDVIQVSPQALQGVHYYDISSSMGEGSVPLFNREMIQEMWSSSDNFNPPFMKRIPFDTINRQSGRALPPSAVHALADIVKENNESHENHEANKAANSLLEENKEKRDVPLLQSILDSRPMRAEEVQKNQEDDQETKTLSWRADNRRIRASLRNLEQNKPVRPAKDGIVDPFGSIYRERAAAIKELDNDGTELSNPDLFEDPLTIKKEPDDPFAMRQGNQQKDYYDEDPFTIRRESTDNDDIPHKKRVVQPSIEDDPFSFSSGPTAQSNKSKSVDKSKWINRGDFKSLRREFDQPIDEKSRKGAPMQFSKHKLDDKSSNKGGLYFPGEDKPPRNKNMIMEDDTESANPPESPFPEVPQVKSRLRQARLGSLRGLMKPEENEEEDSKSPIALQKMINKKLRERVLRDEPSREVKDIPTPKNNFRNKSLIRR